MRTHLKPGHAPRYAALGRLLLEHRGAARLGPGEGAGDATTASDAARLVDELVAMGPTFVKLGQLLSTRSDVLPPEYVEALARLRDEVEPFPTADAIRVIEEDLGFRVSKGFGSFWAAPVGAASLGQVYRATLRDGRPVAVKVQRPGVRRQAADDMEVIAELAAFIDGRSSDAARLGFPAMVEEFRRSLMAELDYRREAANLRLLGEHLAGYRTIVVPQPVDDYTTSRVLTMEYVDGRSVASFGPLGRMELETEALAADLMAAYLDQILVHGFFHADPHPGNVFITDDGRLALIDLGQVARLTPDAQTSLLRLLLAVASRDGTAAAEALEQLGDRLEDYDRDALQARVGDLLLRVAGSSVGDLSAARLMGELAKASSASGLRPRPELTILAKALLDLDEVARILDPGIKVDETIQVHAARVMRHRMIEAASPSRVMRSALDAAAFAEALPGRMNKVLEALAEGDMRISVQGMDEAALLRGAQKLANRVATGVLIAAFLVTAALFAGARGGGRLWGYPVLTIVFLLLALVAAVWLVVGIVRGDLPQRTARSRRS